MYFRKSAPLSQVLACNADALRQWWLASIVSGTLLVLACTVLYLVSLLVAGLVVSCIGQSIDGSQRMREREYLLTGVLLTQYRVGIGGIDGDLQRYEVD